MKVLFCGGEKTNNITKSLEPRFSSGSVEFVTQKSIEDIESYWIKGDGCDRVVVIEQAWTEDGNNLNEQDMRKKLNDFATALTEKSPGITCLFLVTNEFMGKIVFDETMGIEGNSAILVKAPPYTVAFFTELATADLASIPSDLYFDINNYTIENKQKREFTESLGSADEIEIDVEEDGKVEKNNSMDDFDSAGYPLDLDAISNLDIGSEIEFDFESEFGQIDNDNFTEEFMDVPVGFDENDDDIYEDDTKSILSDSDEEDDEQEESDLFLGDDDDDGMNLFDESDDLEESSDDLFVGDEQEEGSDLFIGSDDETDNEVSVFEEEIESEQDNDTGIGVAVPIPTKAKMPKPDLGIDQGNDGESKKKKKGLIAGIKGKKDSIIAPVKPEKKRIFSKNSSGMELKEILNAFGSRGNSISVVGTGCSGNSTVAYNIANTIANLGYTALLVDLDTVNRTQSYMSKAQFEAIHLHDTANASLKLAVNNVSSGIARYANIISPGFHVLTMGLAGDIIKPEDLTTEQKLIRFTNTVKNNYNFVIYDIPFQSAVTVFSDVLYTSDNIVITTSVSNWSIMNTMMAIANVEKDDIQELLFNRAQICFTKYSGISNVLGFKVKNALDILRNMDKLIVELLGESPEFLYANIKVCGILKYDPIHEQCWFANNQPTDYPEWNSIYQNLIGNIVTHKESEGI